MTSALIWHDIHALAQAAAWEFRLPWPIVFKPLLVQHRGKLYGRAHRAPPTIYLRVHRLSRPNVPLARSTIMASLAHELAHLGRKEWNHGSAHRALASEIRQWLRERGQPVRGTV